MGEQPWRARPTREHSRRAVLGLAGASVTSAVLAGCGLFSTESTDPPEDGPDAGGSKGPEAPDLAARVKQGGLPKVDQRLPKQPLILEPLDEVGRYGGELRNVVNYGAAGLPLSSTIGYENLVRWAPGMTEDFTTDQVIPNIASDVQASDDGTEFTFTLRDGMRWSDGEPFTAEDIMFWYQDVLLNAELSPAGAPDWLDTGGDQPLVVEKAGANQVVFRFTAPNGLFLTNLATQRGTEPTSYPAHYLKQFHAKYADDVKKQAKDGGFEDWVQLFQNKHDPTATTDLPVLNAWLLTTAAGGKAQRLVAERNPYYWKTDPDGSQLPYIDRVVYELVNDDEGGVLKVTNGEVDLLVTGINQLQNKPVFADNRDRGNYDFFETIPQQMNQMIVMVNLCHKDPVLRDVFRSKDFRIGLSYALNRQELIDTVWQRQGEPWQAAPRPESPFYNEKLAKQYTDYDVGQANAYLDKVVPDKNGDGNRLRPDGKELFFQVEVATSQPDNVEALDLVRQYWAAVGVQMRVKSEDQDLFLERMDANAHDACVWIGGGGLGPTMDPFYYMPYNFNTRYAMPWSFWYINPTDERAEEPPESTREQIDIYHELLKTPDQDQQIVLMKQILDQAVEEFYCLGVAMRKREYGLVSNRLANVPDSTISGFLHADLMPENPQQFFFTE